MKTMWAIGCGIMGVVAVGCGAPRPQLAPDGPVARTESVSVDQPVGLTLHALPGRAAREKAAVIALSDDDGECPAVGLMNCHDAYCAYACAARRESEREEQAERLLGGANVRFEQ